jgi:hypothetical protein
LRDAGRENGGLRQRRRSMVADWVDADGREHGLVRNRRWGELESTARGWKAGGICGLGTVRPRLVSGFEADVGHDGGMAERPWQIARSRGVGVAAGMGSGLCCGLGVESGLIRRELGPGLLADSAMLICFLAVMRCGKEETTR